MQKDIQPKYEAIKVSCACGNIFEAGSVKDEIKVEICSECHVLNAILSILESKRI